MQIILRWHIQEGEHRHTEIDQPEPHKKAILKSSIYQLSESEMDDVRALDKNKRFFNVPDFVQKMMFRMVKLNLDSK